MLGDSQKIELKPHNQTAVNEIKEHLVNGIKKIIYTAGTGCGKTWVFMGTVFAFKELFPEMNAVKKPKVLYILPKHVIRDNVEGYNEYKALKNVCVVNFATFNYFNNYEKGMNKIAEYDLIVIDECHHLGADLYGQTIVKCMEDSNKWFLGLTATPFRDTDKVDVCDYFDAHVSGISVFDAIRQGLMPMFNYHICLPEKDTKQIEKEYDNEIRAVVDYMDSAEAVYDIVSKYDRKKWICFFNSQEDINNAVESIKEIFEGYKICILLASLRNLEEVMREVRENERVVILSVNILLEGVHLDDIHGIVLYRNVTSTIAFQQMLGRTCSIGNDVEPVIIDTSQAARKILLKLLAENGKGNGAAGGNNGSSNKRIMRVGIGDIIEYDISKILRLCDTKFAKEEELKRATDRAIEKYRSFKGSENYKTFEELKDSGLDYQKFKACAELYHITAEVAWKYWKAG